MKVLYQNRPFGTPDYYIGGDVVQHQAIMKEMKKLGVEVDFSGETLIKPALKLYLYDIVHIFNFPMLWTKYQLWAAKKAKRRIVCSMIYGEQDYFNTWEEQQIMFDNLDAALFLTQGELERLKRHIKIDESKIYFVPNGIDEFWFQKVLPPPDLIEYALTVGRIEEFKGQLSVARVCKKLKIPYVIIGDRVDNYYAAACANEGAVIFPSMSHQDLLKFYAGCKMYILASRAEIMPLSVMEAGAQAKNIILTNHCEWKVPNAEYVEWKNELQIEEAIKKTLFKKPNVEFQSMLKGMTWQKVAKQIFNIYNKILQKNEA